MYKMFLSLLVLFQYIMFGETDDLKPPIVFDKEVSKYIYDRAVSENTVPNGSLSQAKKAVKEGMLKVAFWGDSITEGEDQIDPNDAYVNRVTKLLKESLPNVMLTAQNFAMTGRSLGNAVDSNYMYYSDRTRSWVSPDKSWMQHVKDFAPDLLIVAFGMNDVGPVGLNADLNESIHLEKLVDGIKKWEKVPSLVLVPTILPQTDIAAVQQSLDWSQNQKGTQAVARTTREFARNHGIAIADANRLYKILRDGMDDTIRVKNIETNFEEYSTQWKGDTDKFTLSGSTLTPQEGAYNNYVRTERNFYNGTIEVDITPQAWGDQGVTWIDYRMDETLGKMVVLVVPNTSSGAKDGRVELYKVASDGNVRLAASGSLDIPALGSPIRARVEANGSQHTVKINGTSVLTYTSYRLMHDGWVELGSIYKPPVLSNLTISFEDSLQGEPLNTQEELLGPLPFTNPASGNGVNHPTGKGHETIYLPAFYEIISELKK